LFYVWSVLPREITHNSGENPYYRSPPERRSCFIIAI
jgi:hypothetical protein